MDVVKELSRLVKGRVISSQKKLKKYSSDASAFRVWPKVAVQPKTVSEIKKVVQFVAKHKTKHPELSITVRSAGTDMTGGPLNESIILDVNKHINALKKIGKDYAIVEPGLFYRDLERETLKKKLVYPSYPASKMLCSVGGIVSNNSGGEMSLRYGQTTDWVRGLKVILRDGKEYSFSRLKKKELATKLKKKGFEGDVYRKMHALIMKNYSSIMKAKPQVSKNSTGYLLWRIYDKENETFDLGQVFVGAQGTLGIVTEEKLGLVPVEKHSMTFLMYLKDIDRLGEIVNAVMKADPTTLESYDDKTLTLALKYAPEIAKLISKEESLIKFAWHMMPDFVKVLKMGRFPKLVLMAQFTGNDKKEVRAHVKQLRSLIKRFNVETYLAETKQDAKRYWTIRRQSFNLLRKKIKGKQTVPFIDDIVVPVARMPQFLPKLNKILEKYPSLIYTIAGHAGDGNFHIIPLMDMESQEQRKIIPELSEKVYDLVLKFGGSLSAEHNEGLIRGPYMKKMYGAKMFRLFKEVKNIFDPENIFNPHKKTDASLKFSMAHLKTDNEHDV